MKNEKLEVGNEFIPITGSWLVVAGWWLVKTKLSAIVLSQLVHHLLKACP
jgi:hypothetical protein